MIALLRGRLVQAGPEGVVIDTGGVGYLVLCSGRTLAALPAPGEAVELQIVTQWREDGLFLYGFREPAERAWFRLLQGIPGVGARVALALLAALAPDALAQAVAAQDRRALTRASGVGPKLAARIVAELADRIGQLPAAGGGEAPGAGGAGGAGDDALAALVQLGYGRSEAHGALARARAALGEGAALDALIRAGLKELAGG